MSGYDPKCEELAEHFLSDAPELANLRRSLAQEIQDAIEAWLQQKRDAREFPFIVDGLLKGKLS